MLVNFISINRLNKDEQILIEESRNQIDELFSLNNKDNLYIKNFITNFVIKRGEVSVSYFDSDNNKKLHNTREMYRIDLNDNKIYLEVSSNVKVVIKQGDTEKYISIRSFCDYMDLNVDGFYKTINEFEYNLLANKVKVNK